MADFITVKASSEDGKVVLWERHPEQPDGEVFISGDGKEYRVSRTHEVEIRLKNGSLVEVAKVLTIEPVEPIEPKHFAPFVPEVTEVSTRKGK